MRLANSLCLCLFVSICFVSLAAPALPQLGEAYPDLASGILAQARLDALAEDELMRAGEIVITAAMLDEQISGLPEAVREQVDKFHFYLLENMATESILMRAVLGDMEAEPDEAAMEAQFRAYMLEAVGEVTVSDAEVEAFYEENRAMLPDMDLEQIRPGIQGHLKQEKQEQAWNAHLQSMGSRVSITLNNAWIALHVKRMQDNPVDKARADEKPTLVNFGAEGCPSCVALKPVMQSLRETFDTQASIVEINLNEQQFLASRFNVSSIPLLVFYDKDGNETQRHTGAMSEDEIVETLKKLGAS